MIDVADADDLQRATAPRLARSLGDEGLATPVRAAATEDRQRGQDDPREDGTGNRAIASKPTLPVRP
jgi:hypothetical protein